MYKLDFYIFFRWLNSYKTIFQMILCGLSKNSVLKRKISFNPIIYRLNIFLHSLRWKCWQIAKFTRMYLLSKIVSFRNNYTFSNNIGYQMWSIFGNQCYLWYLHFQMTSWKVLKHQILHHSTSSQFVKWCLFCCNS